MRRLMSIARAALWGAACLLVLAGLLPSLAEAQKGGGYRLVQSRSPVAVVTASALAGSLLTDAGPTATRDGVTAVVRIVVYWAEGCGHCHEVLDGVLPVLQAQYGPRLEVRLVEVVSLEDISAFFDLAEAYGYARGRASVPFLLIGDRALMGVEQIKRELPGLVQAALAAGGTEWPAPPSRKETAGAAITAGDACDFTAPCPEETAAAGSPGAQAVGGTAGSPGLVAGGVVLALGAISGGLLGLRTLRSRTNISRTRKREGATPSRSRGEQCD